MSGKKIFLFAGEQSGDIHGEKLVAALKRSHPNGRIFGVGGPKMRHAGLEPVMKMESFEVMGFIDVFFALPKLMRAFFFLKKTLLDNPPDIVIFIDYPGFNLAMAKALRKKGFKGKICHYICPSVWAWGKRRIPKMEKILDHLFVIFPFEKELFDPKKLKVDYVGHPLVRNIEESSAVPIDIDINRRVIALFPGSREKELHRNFPMQLRVAKRLIGKHPELTFFVSVANPRFSLILDRIMRSEGFLVRDQLMLIDSSQNDALMKRATLAIAKSGTNNLELALHQVPSVVTYGIGPLDLFIAKHLLRINLPHYCIVNIIAKETIFPELIGPNLTEEALFKAADGYLSNPTSMEECRDKCFQLGTLLENKSPEREILNVLENA